MNLFKLLKNVDHTIIQGEDREIAHLSIDSRNLRKDTLFTCISGFRADGHSFAREAAKGGAVAFITEKDIPPVEGVTVIKVENSRLALSYIAADFYNNPEKKMSYLGVTGTNGKTSTTYYLQRSLIEWGKKTGLIGTVETKINNSPVNIDFATSTTPDSIELMQILDYMAKRQVSHTVMEVTSHGLALHKVAPIEFDVSIFTNLTQDHLDLHGTMENYRDAKAKLFAQSKASVINIDDPYGEFMLKKSNKSITYSLEKDSDIKAENISYSPKGVSFSVKLRDNSYDFSLPIPGKFSVYNSLGVIGAGILLDIPVEIIQKALANLAVVPGRVESVPNTKGLNVIVDYAHTPDSLRSIITAARDFTPGKVITVFGCGGDRDKAKRPLMGKVSSELSDFTVLTSDNPRTEEPLSIIEDISAGMSGAYEKITDRKDAIEYAIKMATSADTVIIAGKGHENYQIFKEQTIVFDDVETAQKIIEKN